VRGSGNLLSTRFNLGVRYVPDGVVDRATLRTTLLYRLTQDLQLGVEYNPLAEEVGPLANWRVLRETRSRPAVSLGTSSDRIGTPYGRAYFVTLSKDLEPFLRLPVGVYAGGLYGSYDDQVVVPFGLTWSFAPGWSFNPQFDGHASHGLVSYSWDRYTVTGLLIRWRHPGFAVNIGF
jgi:hypothetical protein